MTGSLLFDRVYKLRVDKIETDSLDITFRVSKTLKTEPNTLELTIMNLNPDHRQQLQETKDPVVQLEAGYKAKSGVIFLGDVRDVHSEYQAPDWVTTIESGDGEKATQFDRINKSFTKGTNLASVLQEVAKSMPDIGIGNLKQLALSGTLPGGTKTFVNGVTLSGSASKEMQKLVRSAGLEWSIQDKKFQLLEAGKTLQSTAIVLTPATGLIGSPTISNDGVLTFTSLLNSDILPGRQLVVASTQVQGTFRVERCTYEGVTKGQPWYVSGEAKEISLI
jgi:hypothetical protein